MVNQDINNCEEKSKETFVDGGRKFSGLRRQKLKIWNSEKLRERKDSEIQSNKYNVSEIQSNIYHAMCHGRINTR